MNFAAFRELTIASVTQPANAARFLLAQSLPQNVLWVALVLVAVLNAIVFTVSQLLVQAPDSALPGLFASPIVYLGFVFGALVIMIYAIFWTGRGLGGQAALEDVMVVMIWLQVLRVIVQLAALVLVLTVPVLSALLVFAAAVIGTYILLHFVNEAHRLGSLWRAAGVLIASVVAMTLGLSLLLSLTGAPLIGV